MSFVDTNESGSDVLASLDAAAHIEQPALDIQVTRQPNRAKSTVTVSMGGNPVFVDQVNLASEKARDRLAEKIVAAGAEPEEVKQHLLQLAIAPPPAPLPDVPLPDRAELLAGKDEMIAERLNETPQEVLREARAMLKDPRLFDLIMVDIEASGVVGERDLRASCYLIGTSRLLKKPVAGLVQGVSSSGKSYVADRVRLFFPEEATLKAHGITANALYYLPPDRLIHCWVVAGERLRYQSDETIDTFKAMREILADGELCKLVPERAPDGTLTTRHIRKYGPIAYTESSTAVQIFDEDFNRMIPLASDESQEQTKRIIHAQAKAVGGEDGINIEGVYPRHHAAQRMLKRVIVDVPFAEQLAQVIPLSNVRVRRAFTHLLSTIQAVALLHQYQRCEQPEHGMHIKAMLQDYAIASKLLTIPLGRALNEGLPPAVVRFGRDLQAVFHDKVFDTAEAKQKSSVLGSKSKVNEYLSALADAGHVHRVELGRGRNPSKWRFVSEVVASHSLNLPTIAELEALA